MEDGGGTLSARLWPLACRVGGAVSSMAMCSGAGVGVVRAVGGVMDVTVIGESNRRGGCRARFGRAETLLADGVSATASGCGAAGAGTDTVVGEVIVLEALPSDFEADFA